MSLWLLLKQLVASRNVAFKSDKPTSWLRPCLKVNLLCERVKKLRKAYRDADFEDLGRNADLYIFNQDVFEDGWRAIKCMQGGVLLWYHKY